MPAAPIQTKVKAATAASLLVGVAIAVLNAVTVDAASLSPLPGRAQAAVLAVAPATLTFLGGLEGRPHPASHGVVHAG